MNTFKKKSVYAALAGVSALGVVNVAQAVSVSGDGTGQVLLYPYYTTRADALGNEFSTLLSVVNTQNTTKAVKVRFIEGKNSREVLDFNLFLSPYDVWTAAVSKEGDGAKVSTADKSCTLPAFPASGSVPFVNYRYTGDYDDGGGASLDRTKEGYIEIIEMANYASSTDTAKYTTHADGVPQCGKLTLAMPEVATGRSGPAGGLFGSLQLMNVMSGTAFSADATALANYSESVIYAEPGSVNPDLRLADPPASQVVVNDSVYTSNWTDGSADPVSAVLMHASVLNEYVLDANTLSRTDWVVTFPTKGYYVKKGTGEATKLFQRNFNKTDGSCDDVLLNIFDREERTSSTPLNFSPPPPTRTASICWEANVLSFSPASGGSTTASPVLGSTNVSFVPYVFQNGWLKLGFQAIGTSHKLVNSAATAITTIGQETTTGNTVTYEGLPVIGFATISYTNGTVTVGGKLVQSSYGVDFGHRYNTVVSNPQ